MFALLFGKTTPVTNNDNNTPSSGDVAMFDDQTFPSLAATHCKPFVEALANPPPSPVADTFTENGALAFSTTHNALLDFFFQAVRGLTGAKLNELLGAAWAENPLLTLKAIFQARDIRGKGKGERALFRECVVWLANHDPVALSVNIQHIPEYGRWDDLYALWPVRDFPGLNKTLWDAVLHTICEQVKKDWESLLANRTTPEKCRVSLLAKWLPTEGSKTWPADLTKSVSKAVHKAIGKTRKIKVTHEYVLSETFDAAGAPAGNKLVRKLKLGEPGKKVKSSFQNYRNIGVALREVLDLPEVLLAAKRSDEVDFNTISGQAMRRLGKTCNEKCGDKKCKQCKAFIRNQKQRYSAFLAELAKPKEEKDPDVVAKVNSRTLQPHEVIAGFQAKNCDPDEMLNAMWEGIKERVPQEVVNQFFCMIDVSGSMAGLPVQVAIALGLLIATKANGAFAKSFITFEVKPRFITLETDNIHDQIQEMGATWLDGSSGNTNFYAAIMFILNQAKRHSLVQADLPKYFLVLSDMQFDDPSYGASADRSWQTNLQKARGEFEAAGYKMPRLILWNLKATENFPTSTKLDDNASLMSGFSPDVLECMLKGEEFNPASSMLNTLNDPRYDRLLLA